MIGISSPTTPTTTTSPEAGRRVEPGAVEGGSTAASRRAVQPDMSTSAVGVRRHDVVEAGGDRRERCAARPRSAASASATGRPASPPAGHGGLERHLAEQRHADLVGQRLPTAGPEQRVALPWSHVKAVMFSITPTTRTKLRRAMSAARWATFWAASAGVVTITMSARAAGGTAPSARRRCPAACRSAGRRARPTGRRAGTARRPW